MEFSKVEIVTVIAVLSGTIGVLWVMIKAWLQREQRRLQKCEEMHAKAIEKITELNGKYNYLQGRMDGAENLITSLLEEIRKLQTNRATVKEG